MSTNPLKHFARTPKIYIKLPQNNLFYPDDLFHKSPTGEVPVKAMTASDDLMMNTPDALLNGDAVFHTLNSCLVNCKDVKQLLVPDVETILLAIRYASHGDKLKMNTTCPSCETKHEETLQIRTLLDATQTLEDSEINPVYTITHDDGSEVKINLKPSPYTDATRANIVVYEQTRLVQFLSRSTDIEDQERQERIKTAYDKLAQFQLNTLINSIDSIDIVTKDENGDSIISKVTDKTYIAEFLGDLDNVSQKSINKILEQLNTEIGVPNEFPVTCNECNHEYNMEVKFDPTNFSDET